MADILIHMEMPTQCGNCPISTNTRRCTILWREFGNPSKRLEDCPLVPLPEGHGRLGDLDALMEIIRAHDYPLTAHFNSTDNGMFTLGIQQAVNEAPTIVPAEGGDKE